MPYSVPALQYAYDALEPHIDEATMRLHHDKHHQAYVDKANAALEGTGLDGKPVEELLRNLSTLPPDRQESFRNNGGGHANHMLFWESMSPDGGAEPGGELGEAIVAKFGSFDEFKGQFVANGVAQFGSGWTWLVLNRGELELTKTPNQDSPLLAGATPLLGNDVWEHAYYLQYRNKRPDYLEAWWNVVSWDRVAERYASARGPMTAVETLSFTKNGTRAADGDGMTVEQLVPGFAPETALERELTADPMLLRGLVWGRPRPGHPEGTVGHHVRDILSAISEPSGRRRAELRFLALVHDAFKYRVRPDAGYAPGNDHAVLARRFAERYTRDPRLLETLELHDAAYYIWRTRTNDGCVTLHALLARVPDLDLFLRFVELDNSTEGKDPRPLAWLRAAVDAGADLPELAVAGAWSDTRRRRRAVSPCHRSSSERRAVAHRVAAGEQGMSVAEKGEHVGRGAGATDAGSSAES